jgi:hypothetical protein
LLGEFTSLAQKKFGLLWILAYVFLSFVGLLWITFKRLPKAWLFLAPLVFLPGVLVFSPRETLQASQWSLQMEGPSLPPLMLDLVTIRQAGEGIVKLGFDGDIKPLVDRPMRLEGGVVELELGKGERVTFARLRSGKVGPPEVEVARHDEGFEILTERPIEGPLIFSDRPLERGRNLKGGEKSLLRFSSSPPQLDSLEEYVQKHLCRRGDFVMGTLDSRQLWLASPTLPSIQRKSLFLYRFSP